MGSVMSIEHSRMLASKWFLELWSEGKLSVADQIVAVDYAPSWVQIDKSGPDQVKYEVSYFRSIFPDLDYRIEDMAAFEDRVWIRYTASGTQLGTAWGFEATREEVTFDGATILYIDQDGKICDRWGAFCIYDILAELGLVPHFWEISAKLKNIYQEQLNAT